MNELQIFKNNEFGEVRTKVINNEPYFSLTDICRILEINNPRMAKKSRWIGCYSKCEDELHQRVQPL